MLFSCFTPFGLPPLPLENAIRPSYNEGEPIRKSGPWARFSASEGVSMKRRVFVTAVAAAFSSPWRRSLGGTAFPLPAGPLSARPVRRSRRRRKRRVTYQAVEVEGGGTITGCVRWEGPPPPQAEEGIPCLAEPDQIKACCGGGTEPCKKLLGRIVVDPKTKGVANTVVFLTDITKGKPLPKPGVELFTGKKAVLEEKNCYFIPHVMAVAPETQLKLLNSDPVPNTFVARMGLNQLFNLQLSKQGQVIEGPETSVRKEPGVIDVRCTANHPWQSAFVFVLPHPYYAVTDKEGRFTIKDVPPGEYTIRCWHESWLSRFAKNEKGEITEVFYGRPIREEKKITVKSKAVTTVNFVRRSSDIKVTSG